MIKRIKKMGLVYGLSLLIAIIIGLLVSIVNVFNPSPENVGLIGAIFGGLISGGLTLAGVYLTLEQQGEKEFTDKYPMIKNNTDEILNSLEFLVNNINQLITEDKLNTEDESKIVNEIFNTDQITMPKYIKMAISCGGNIFAEMQKVKKELGWLVKYIESNSLSEIDALGVIHVQYSLDKEIVNDHNQAIVKALRNISKDIQQKERRFNSYFGI